MSAKTLCTKCNSETRTKRMNTNLIIDSKGNSISVSARVQECNICNYREITKKEKERLRDLASFYRREMELQEEEDTKEESV